MRFFPFAIAVAVAVPFTLARAAVPACVAEQTVIREPVTSDGLVGTLLRPTTPSLHRAVLVLGGSNGGLDERWACRFARAGLASLALAYFREPGLPPALDRIPLEYFEKAMAWLQRQPSIPPGGISVVGASRGGELALLLGTRFPERVRAVVAHVPSHVVWEGIETASPGVSAWTWRGQDIPFLRFDAAAVNFAQSPPWSLRPGFERALLDAEAARKAAIPVEKIRGPVLLVSGGDDAMWPASPMSESVIDRLRAHAHPYEYVHLQYPDAGHFVAVPLTANVFGNLALGGTAEANARAAADASPKVLRFLTRSTP